LTEKNFKKQSSTINQSDWRILNMEELQMTTSKQEAMENLAYIKEVLADTRKITLSSGSDYILWGFLIFFGMIGTYLPAKGLLMIRSGWYFMILWGGLTLTGWLLAMFGIKRQKTGGRSKLLGSIWLATGVSLSLIPFLGVISGLLSPKGIAPVLSCVLGTAYYITGALNEYKWMKFVALGWWLGAIILFFWQAPENYLLFSLMMILLQVLPGVKMNKLWKEQNQNNG
jgi:hypothetical protein